MQRWFHPGRLSSICGRVAEDDGGGCNSGGVPQAAAGGAVVVVVWDRRMAGRFYVAVWHSNGVDRSPAAGGAEWAVVRVSSVAAAAGRPVWTVTDVVGQWCRVGCHACQSNVCCS